MIWTRKQITAWAQAGGVAPFDPACVNNASLDLRWSGRVRRAIKPCPLWALTGKILPASVVSRFCNQGGWGDEQILDTLVLQPHDLVLLDTLEYIEMPLDAGGSLMLKSSMGRKGLEHLHAGWFDPGFVGTGTLEIANFAPWPVTIQREQRIVQMVFMETIGDADAYSGRYVGQHGPTVAR